VKQSAEGVDRAVHMHHHDDEAAARRRGTSSLTQRLRSQLVHRRRSVLLLSPQPPLLRCCACARGAMLSLRAVTLDALLLCWPHKLSAQSPPLHARTHA
jgi:hypothetical protein